MSKNELAVIETYRTWTILLDADRGHYYGSRDLDESRATGTMDICAESSVDAVRAKIDAVLDHQPTAEEIKFISDFDAGVRNLLGGKF